MTIFKLFVKKDDPKKLGSFLLKNGFSHQALIKARHNGGLVLVNHKRRYNSYHLKINDEVIFIPAVEKKNPWLQPSDKKIDVVFENKNYLVINKPAGVLSIPSRYEDKDAIVNRVLGYFNQKGQKNLKPHVITRLDRDTSGLVVVGKNSVTHARFSKMGKDNFIKKYHAIVHGNFTKNELEGLINAPIDKVSNGVKRGVVQNGKSAKTEYCVIAQKKGYSLVELRLLTGRTHQIRVHMAYSGHILVGDHLYGSRDIFPRQALNCFSVTFQDPFTNEKVALEINDPRDMTNLWNNL